jgi:hypothetical protein
MHVGAFGAPSAAPVQPSHVTTFGWLPVPITQVYVPSFCVAYACRCLWRPRSGTVSETTRTTPITVLQLTVTDALVLLPLSNVPAGAFGAPGAAPVQPAGVTQQPYGAMQPLPQVNVPEQVCTGVAGGGGSLDVARRLAAQRKVGSQHLPAVQTY